MKKTFTYLTTAIATLALSTSLSATTAAPAAGAQMVMLDTNKIMSDSKAAKSLNKQMEELREKYVKDVSSKEEALRKEQEQIKAKQPNMKEADLEKEAKQFEAKVAKLQKTVMEQENQMNGAAQEALNTISSTVVKISTEEAKTRGATVVMSLGAGVVYFDPSLDITTKVIEALDKQLPDVKVVLKEAPAPAAEADKKK